MDAQKTSLNCNKVDNCSLTLVLDKRTNKSTDEYPMAICFTINRKRYYHKLTDMPFQKERYFNEVCSVTSSRSSLMPIQKEWQKILEDYRQKLVKLKKNQDLTLDVVKSAMAGVTTSTANPKNFITFWEDLIKSYEANGQVGTADNYACALNSFKRIVGKVDGFKIDVNIMKKWDDVLTNGITKDGVEIVAPVKAATKGMYYRACRVAWNECIKQGLLPEEKYPFSNKEKSKLSIPRGAKRQTSYLSIDEMTELYYVFMERRYPDTWGSAYKHRVHYSLGLFLAQYLCNGFNLADAGRITYDRTYYAEGGRCVKFERHKTHRNVNGEATVIVPIITPLQNILDQIAAKPSKGARVFPDIFKGSNDERVMRKLCVQENSNIKDRVIRVCKEVLGWEKEPSSTWARHAFASNLKMLKVPEEYVSEGMGHSQGNNITRGYQDMYSLEMRFEFNNKLLNLKENQEPEVDVDSMTPEEMKEFIKRMIGK